MHVPSQRWAEGSWNNKLDQLNSLGRMVGLKPNPSWETLDATIGKVASAKVFGESIQPFLDETGKSREEVIRELKAINDRLGLMEPLPFMTTGQGFTDPASFDGVALLPPGITNWSVLRHTEIVRSHKAGANFQRVVVLWSSRKCNAPADLRHPYIKDRYQQGEEPTEWKLMHDIVDRDGVDLKYEFAELPQVDENGRPLSLEKQLNHLVESGQYEALVGDKPVYVPSTPNSLYVPLHAKRVLGLKDIAFSQAGARQVATMPSFWWDSLQEIMTTPNGTFRLWKELVQGRFINKG